jgi:hypothetical protein
LPFNGQTDIGLLELIEIIVSNNVYPALQAIFNKLLEAG